MGIRGLLAISVALSTAVVATPGVAKAAPAVPSCVTTAVDSQGLSAELCGEVAGVVVGSTENVTYSCQATVLGVVYETGVGCQLFGVTAGYQGCACNVFLPGTTSAEAAEATNVPVDTYYLCIAWYYVTLPTSGGVPVSHPCVNVTPVL